jgi:hypothetical protein
MVWTIRRPGGARRLSRAVPDAVLHFRRGCLDGLSSPCRGLHNTAMAKVISSSFQDGLMERRCWLPFLGGGNTRSCFMCGKHRQQAQLRSKRILGRSEMVCAPSCTPAE